MILDKENQLSASQALTATAVSGNTIDNGLVTPKRDIGNGEAMELVMCVEVAADFTTGNETYQLDFIQSANANLSSPDVLASRIIAAADLTAGSIHHMPLPKGAITKRYIGAQYTLGGTTPTITVSTYLQPVNMSESRKDYADGFNIS